MTRHAWDELPDNVRAAIERETGPVSRVEVPDAGRNSDFSATLHVAGGVVFCKGISDAEGRRGRMHRHECDVNPHLPPAIAPRLRWSTEAEGWLLLGFDRVPGHHADLAPGSPDLPLVTDMLSTLTAELARTSAVAPRLAEQWAWLAAWRRLAADIPVDLDQWSRDRLDLLIDWELRAIEAVDGDSLVHTDLHALNIIVGEGRAHVIDWAWSRIGDPAIDIAFMINRLVAAGHTPNTAEEWAEQIPAWRATSPDTRTAFSVAILGIWEDVERHSGLPSGLDLTGSARRWAQHRLGMHAHTRE